MTKEEMYVRNFKIITTGLLLGLTLIIAGNLVERFHQDATSITLRQLDTMDNVKTVAQARSQEARFLSEKAMFESMKK